MPRDFEERIAHTSQSHPYSNNIVLSTSTPFSVPTNELTTYLSSGNGECAKLPHGLPSRRINIRVLQAFTPFTLSVALKVQYEDPDTGAGRVALLKLFDRRFMTNVRFWKQLPDWTPESEHLYKEYALSESATEFQMTWKQLDDMQDCPEVDRDLIRPDPDDQSDSDEEEDTDEDDDFLQWKSDPRRVEALVQYESLMVFSRELRAYELMSHLQGKAIPKLLGTVGLNQLDGPSARETDLDGHDGEESAGCPRSSTNYCKDEEFSSFFTIPGLLLEFIDDSFTLSRLPSRVPRHDWLRVLNQVTTTAGSTVHTGFFNEDTRPDNVLLVQRRKPTPRIPENYDLSVKRRALGLETPDTECSILQRSRNKSIGERDKGVQEIDYEYEVRIIDFGSGSFRRCTSDYTWLIEKAAGNEHLGASLTMETTLRREHGFECKIRQYEEYYPIVHNLDAIGKREFIDLKKVEAETEEELPHWLPDRGITATT